MTLERPRITRIESIEWETERHATITFSDDAIAASPAGTFCMVWVPGVDEVPMGTGATTPDGLASLTVEAKGDCTKAMLALPVGSKIGVRGPYGQGFSLPAEPSKICFVGGGTGIAPMARGAQQAHAAGHEVTIISGARSENLLLLHDYLTGQDGDTLRYLPCTDDGSFGFDGFTTQQLEKLSASGDQFDLVVACGPEGMMVRVAQLCHASKVACQASLERYMKCAVGICDACTVGDGVRLCLEGPVLTKEQLAKIPEFGVGHRDAAGVMHPW